MRILSLFVIAALAGCMDYQIKELADMTLEQCESTCDPYVTADDNDPQCNTTCGPDGVGFSLGTIQGGGTCNLGVVCDTTPNPCRELFVCDADPVCDNTQPDSCVTNYQTCVDDTGDLVKCGTERADCENTFRCLNNALECYCDANHAYNDCVANNWTGCDVLYDNDTNYCDCVYDGCLIHEGDSQCGMAERVLGPQKTGDGSFTVTRAWIDHEMARQAQLDAEVFAWPVPNANRKGMVGVAIGSIQPGTAFHDLGLRNGDLVVTINGGPFFAALHHPDQLRALRNTDDIVLGIVRAGVGHTLHYHLVP